jgi:hypothetical protein
MARFHPKGVGFIAVAGLIPIGLFYYFHVKYPVNIPFEDDFNFPFEFLIAPPSEQISSLLSFYAEHRILLPRLFFWFTTNLLQLPADLRIAMWVGNLSILGFAYLYWRCLPMRQRLLLFLTIICLLFQVQGFAGMYWADTALMYGNVVLFALLALYCLAQGFPLIWGILFAVLASLTFGNGTFTWLVGLVILVAQRNFKRSLWWAFCSVLMLGWYFHDYQKPAYTPTLSDTLSHLPDVALGFVSYLGTYVHVGLPFEAATALLVGALVLLWIIVLVLAWLTHLWGRSVAVLGRFQTSMREYPKIWFFLMGGFTFLLITSAGVAVGRAVGGYETVFISRYKINGEMLLILCYISLLYVLPARPRIRLVWTTTALTLALNLYTFVYYAPQIKHHRLELVLSLHNGLRNQHGWLHYDNQLANTVTQEVIKRGFYEPPPLPDFLGEISTQPITDTLQSVQVSVETRAFQFGEFREKRRYLQVRYDEALIRPDALQLDTGWYVVLRSGNATYVYTPTIPTGSLDLIRRRKGFVLTVPTVIDKLTLRDSQYNIAPGKYQVLVLERTNVASKLYDTTHQVNI